MNIDTCNLDVNTTLPLVCVCSLFSFLCGVGIGANDLSANFAMVVGSGSLNMKQAIIYCTVFELLGAAFMGGRVSSTIRNGIVDPVLFTRNRDVVVIGMTASSMAAALWLYLSTVFGLPVSITHTVVGSLLGFAIFSTMSFQYVKVQGVVVIVLSWIAAPLAACAVTALIFHLLRRDVFKVKGRSFELALRVLPYCLAATLLVDYLFVVIVRPPIMTATLAQWVPVVVQFVLLFLVMVGACYVAQRWYFPLVEVAAKQALEFVWESRAVRTEADMPLDEQATAAEEEQLDLRLSFFSTKRMQVPEPPSSTLVSHNTSGTYAPPPVSGPSMVLSSIVPSDSRVVQQRSVRIARAWGGRKSPMRSPKPQAAPYVVTDGGSSSYPPLGGSEALPLLLPTATTAAPHTFASGDYGYGAANNNNNNTASVLHSSVFVAPLESPAHVPREDDEFGDEDWGMDHPMEPINFGGLLIKPFNPRAEFLFTSLQVVAGSMSSFVHGAVAGANATAAFVILYDAFTNHELGEKGLSTQWSVLPAMLGIAIGMFGLGARLMKTVGMELVTVTPARGWCIQVGGTAVTMALTGLGIPVSLSQSQVGAAIGCGVVDAGMSGVSWPLVLKIAGGWVVTLVISATTAGLSMWAMAWLMC